MTDEQAAALREKARAALNTAAADESPWYEECHGRLLSVPTDADARFVVAASPAVVLSLLDEREALREAVQVAEQKMNTLRDVLIDNRTAEIDAYDLVHYAGHVEEIAAAIRAALSGSAAP